ncbi:peptide chain release factor 2 [Furfurilactobacillus rossiae]|uniref:peptide chain release factor 2 n=1 Tax=Furfurilactobacillus rossiae TaxID=231049 RepID=UPI001265FAED|nr:peptide chain release factor 2 [Furfurilactobacillus rossiae]QFR66573.1 peptide chain release factor 2 [Furfurilactobacillus rossiae]
MELADARQRLADMQQQITNFRGSLDLDALNQSIAENEARMAEPHFWDDNVAAQQVIDDNNALKAKHDTFMELDQAVEDLAVTIELLEEDDDPEMAAQLDEEMTNTAKKLQSYRLTQLLDQPYDGNNAILEIHPGAGGTESQDWGQNLMRMYTRWAEQHQFKVDIVDYQAGDTAGLNSATLLISGTNAYGYLRSEKGVHRFVRISPFDSAGRRHTSFVSVDVMPELDDSVQVDLSPDDIKMEVFRSSGAGGQHINKTSSAVRLIHIPTGIVVSSQAQRSQFQNKATAMSMLKAKLYEREEQKKAEEKAKLEGTQLEIGWGSQIRSYVFQPYTMVKDHRTDYETGNAQAVLDGDLDPFIDAYLQWNLKQKNPD